MLGFEQYWIEFIHRFSRQSKCLSLNPSIIHWWCFATCGATAAPGKTDQTVCNSRPLTMSVKLCWKTADCLLMRLFRVLKASLGCQYVNVLFLSSVFFFFFWLCLVVSVPAVLADMLPVIWVTSAALLAWRSNEPAAEEWSCWGGDEWRLTAAKHQRTSGRFQLVMETRGGGVCVWERECWGGRWGGWQTSLVLLTHIHHRLLQPLPPPLPLSTSLPIQTGFYFLSPPFPNTCSIPFLPSKLSPCSVFFSPRPPPSLHHSLPPAIFS